ASAQPLTDDAAQAAKLFRESARLYDEGRFVEAAELLREAYRRKPEPVLQYNLGRACAGMGDLECAITAYSTYVETEPSLPDRAATEQRRAPPNGQPKTQRGASAATQQPVAPPPAQARPPRQRPAAASVAPWVVAATGVLGVAAGVVFGVVSKAAKDD